MLSDWQRITLQDLIDFNIAHLQTGPFGTALKASEYSENGVPLISVGEIGYGHLKISAKTPRVNSETVARLPKFLLEEGDIVFGRKGGIDRNAIIRPEQVGWFLGSDGIRLRLSNDVHHQFFSYQMRNPFTRFWLLQNSEGTTMPSLNQSILGRLPVVLPPFREQRSIAHILGSLDDKIELNRQINTTLENMAQTLFKSWFVDFDPVLDNALAAGNPIPDALAEKAAARKALGDARKALPEDIRRLFPAAFVWTEEMGWVPEGWKQGQLQDILVLQRGFDLPKSKRTAGKFPLIASSGQDGTHNESKAIGPGVVTGRSGRIGIVTFVHENYWPLNTTLWVKKYGSSNPYHSYFLLNNLDLDKYRTGSAVPTLNRNHVHSLPQILPPKAVLRAFEVQSAPIFEKKRVLTKNSLLLAKLRDTLLPKLLSGELRIPEAEELTEAALS